MKKSRILITALTGTLFIFAAFVRTAGPSPADPPKGMNDSVWAVVKKSCYDCHSNDGNSMAKSKINFDNWAGYSETKQLAKAQNMCNMLQKGKMPPPKYRTNNPDAVPTTADVALVCNWAKQTGK